MGFLEDLIRKYGARMVRAAPLRVALFNHDLQNKPRSNQKAARDILKSNPILLRSLEEGELFLCPDAIVLITKDSQFPIKFFYVWKEILVFKKPAVTSALVWCDEKYRHLKIENKPLASYCLFDYLLPKYKIVVSGEEHTPDGERFEKNQIKYAVSNNIFVYAKDEHNQLFQIDDPSVVVDAANVFWGELPEHKKRLFIYSREKLL